ncbi:MAG: threonine--tRNA ligase [Candidatus Komeilibacteria bacterium]
MSKQEKINLLRHSAAHLMAASIQKLYPQAKFGIGPVIDNGFYYDVEIANVALTEADLPKITKQMKRLIQDNIEFKKEEMSIDDAIKLFAKADQNYKVELLKDLKAKGTTKMDDSEAEVLPAGNSNITIYRTGDFVDLCRGPHVDSSKELKISFKLDRLAGAYWRGNEKNPMLTRIYAVAFDNQKELDEYLELMEEAKKRDHRKLGKEMDIFHFDDLVGKGLPLWLPKGTILRDQVEKLAKEYEDADGYQRVVTPHLAKKELYLQSGHLPYYHDDMYPAMEMDDGTYYLKAMNCPHHHLIFKARPRSYRDMPLRLAEYGVQYRNELSGTLAGLLRVRMLSMNDAHIYCTKDQVKDEFKKVIDLTLKYFSLFGLKDYWFRLSKWDPEHTEKYIAEPDNWEYTQKVIKEVLDKAKVKYTEVDDEAAFYGPKVDIQFKSIIGREESMSTIQLDFAAKKRFNLTYIDNQGQANNEIFVIHRAPLSTHERFMAFLIEHYAGAFPVWLAPTQISILPVGESHRAYCDKLADKFRAENMRVEVDNANETIGNKVRKAIKFKAPYILVIGDQEIKSDKLHVRLRGTDKLLEIPEEKFIARVKEEIEKRKDQ